MIPAKAAVKAIDHERGDSILVGTMTPNRDLATISTNPDMDLPIFGAMGKASSVGLGLALARPTERVIVLDGDGAILMNLGSLVTIAGQEPANLVLFVFEDGVYFSTGSQPVPGAGKFNLAAIARAAGINESYVFDNLEDFVSELPGIMKKNGPVFVCLKVTHASEETPDVYIGKSGPAMRRLSAKLHENP